MESNKTVRELNSEVQGLKESIKNLIGYFMKNNPDIIPIIEIDHFTETETLSNNITRIVEKGVDVDIQLEFKIKS